MLQTINCRARILSELGNGLRVLFFIWPTISLLLKNKKALKISEPLILLVEVSGIEPLTF